MLTQEDILKKCKADDLDKIINVDCWGDDLSDVSIVRELTNAQILGFPVNQIKTLEPFSHCLQLKELYLRRNDIESLEEVLYLQNCKGLRILWLGDNPISKLENYRKFVIDNLPQISRLDNIPIARESQDKSHNRLTPDDKRNKADLRQRRNNSTKDFRKQSDNIKESNNLNYQIDFFASGSSKADNIELKLCRKALPKPKKEKPIYLKNLEYYSNKTDSLGPLAENAKNSLNDSLLSNFIKGDLMASTGFVAQKDPNYNDLYSDIKSASKVVNSAPRSNLPIINAIVSLLESLDQKELKILQQEVQELMYKRRARV